jgi:CheY-like chemotaxis protein
MVPSHVVSPLYSQLGLHISLVEDRSSERVGLHALVVDDSATHRLFTSATLLKRGYRVTCVNDGLEAVAAWLKQHFDVVLMDIEMPNMDGITATVEIRQREVLVYAYTPIVALTSTKDYEKCFEAGMDGFTAKPLNVEHLEQILGGATVVRPQQELCTV